VTQTLVRQLDPELVELARLINVVGGGRQVPRYPRTSHVEEAVRVRELSPAWCFVAVYRSATTARTLVSQIRNGLHDAYPTPGAWLAEALPAGVGTGLFVKYVGGGPDA
jgi:hypothetical protein